MGACCSCCCEQQLGYDSSGHHSGNGSRLPSGVAPSSLSSSLQMSDTPLNVAARRRAQRDDDDRAMLRRLPHESLAWVQLTNCDAAKGISKPYYWSAITGESVWDKPPNFYSLVDGPRLPARIADLPDCVRVCERFNIRFHLAEENLDDPIFGRLIGGTPPDLAHCLFYQPFLVKELSVYPSEFMRKMGLKQITLMDRLSYDGQARRAITVAGTGTLYLDPGPLAIYYLQDVFHHELFHLLDYPMLAERETVLSHANIPGRAPSPLSPSLQPSMDYKHQYSGDGSGSSTGGATSPNIMNGSNGTHPSSSMVWRSTDWEARQRRGLLAAIDNSSGSDSGSEGNTPTNDRTNDHHIINIPSNSNSNNDTSLHNDRDHPVPSLSSSDRVLTHASSQSADGDPIDHRWLSFNPPGFVYGQGGAKTREAGAFLSSGTVAESVVSGFLNRYSMSAPEEDKAEIYAGLFRHAPALLQSDDPIIAMKAYEMKERLEGFCPALNDAFWLAVLNHTPLHVKRAREGPWEQKQDPHGHFYWYNSVTLQVSWLKPTLFDSPPPRPVLVSPSPSSFPSTSISPSVSSSVPILPATTNITATISSTSPTPTTSIVTAISSSVSIAPSPSPSPTLPLLTPPPPLTTTIVANVSVASPSPSLSTRVPNQSLLPSASTPSRHPSSLAPLPSTSTSISPSLLLPIISSSHSSSLSTSVPSPPSSMMVDAVR